MNKLGKKALSANIVAALRFVVADGDALRIFDSVLNEISYGAPLEIRITTLRT